MGIAKAAIPKPRGFSTSETKQLSMDSQIENPPSQTIRFSKQEIPQPHQLP
jgi:hypothetical protein